MNTLFVFTYIEMGGVNHVSAISTDSLRVPTISIHADDVSNDAKAFTFTIYEILFKSTINVIND